MVKSDHSDEGEEGAPSKTSHREGAVEQKSLAVTKRSREDSSEDEKIELPSKRPRSNIKESEEKDTSGANGSAESSEEPMDVDKPDDKDSPAKPEESAKSDIRKDSQLVKPDSTKNGDSLISLQQGHESDNTTESSKPDVHSEEENEKSIAIDKDKDDVGDGTLDASDKTNGDEDLDEKKDVKDDKGGKKDKKNKSVKAVKKNDSEVVDGLELSVECASDKELSSSESDKEKEVKPRPKTIIVKAKPNDSELEVSSSEAEKSDEEDKDEKDEMDEKIIKRKGKRKSFTKVKSSGSEESSYNNSDDEDYSPRTKKRMKKLTISKKTTSKASDSKKTRGRGEKKSTKEVSEDDKSDEDKSDKSEDDEMSLADRAKKSTKSKGKDKPKEKSSSSSDSEEDVNDDSEDSKDAKNGKRKQRNTQPENNKKIQLLKKYIRAAGISVRSYQDVWSGCTTNKARIERLKEFLEKNGVHGRPTLEKCKKAKMENKLMKDVAELDTRNIISEGRITRARKGAEAIKKSVASPILVSPTKQREAKNTLRRIRSVVDSDSD